jgi:hypothetical protein
MMLGKQMMEWKEKSPLCGDSGLGSERVVSKLFCRRSAFAAFTTLWSAWTPRAATLWASSFALFFAQFAVAVFVKLFEHFFFASFLHGFALFFAELTVTIGVELGLRFFAFCLEFCTSCGAFFVVEFAVAIFVELGEDFSGRSTWRAFALRLAFGGLSIGGCDQGRGYDEVKYVFHGVVLLFVGEKRLTAFYKIKLRRSEKVAKLLSDFFLIHKNHHFGVLGAEQLLCSF